MRKVKTLITLAFSAAVVSFFLVGCQGNNEHPTGDNQNQEHPAANDKANDKAADDKADDKADAAEEEQASEAEHPTKEHPTSEHPTEEESAEEQPN